MQFQWLWNIFVHWKLSHMKQKILITVCDPKEQKHLEMLLNKYCPEMNISGSFDPSKETIYKNERESTSLLLLEVSSFAASHFNTFSQEEKNNHLLIFLVNTNDFTINILQRFGLDYLQTPTIGSDLRKTIDNAIDHLELRRDNQELQDKYYNALQSFWNHIHTGQKLTTHIEIPHQFGSKLINLTEVTYIQADGDYAVLHFADRSIIVGNLTLDDFEQRLQTRSFCRINNATIINLDYLESVSGNMVILKCKTRLTLSRKKMNDFRSR
jgi:two-component system, LytTR family, response regulator